MPIKIPPISFTDEVKNTYNIKDFEGQIVILYFQASQCIDYITELKRLDILNLNYYIKILQILKSYQSLQIFKSPVFLYSTYKEAKIKNLNLFLDKNKKIMKTIGVSGASYTIILDKNLPELMRTKQVIKQDNQIIINQLVKLRSGPVKKYQSDASSLTKEEQKRK